MKKIYKYPSCILNSGYSRGIIQDTFQSKYYFIPSLLLNILGNENGNTLNEVKSKYDNSFHELFDSYFDFLLEKKIIYYTTNEINFNELSLEFDYPAAISNCIMIIDDGVVEEIRNRILLLENLGCEHIQFFIVNNTDIQYLRSLLNIFNNSRFSTIEISLSYNDNFSDVEELKNLFRSQLRLFNILLFNAHLTQRLLIDKMSNQKHISYTKENISYDDCGYRHPILFNNNLQFFAESQAHNTCLNLKLCIDSDGNIKNCPAMKRSFGNVKDTTLQEAIEKPGFKDLWFIHKDQIDVCKDCEFRHMCMDCRCFIKDPENIYSQPAKCTYNPYICKWEGQERYVPVEECGNYGGETGFVPNHEKIKELNKQIWGNDE